MSVPNCFKCLLKRMKLKHGDFQGSKLGERLSQSQAAPEAGQECGLFEFTVLAATSAL